MTPKDGDYKVKKRKKKDKASKKTDNNAPKPKRKRKLCDCGRGRPHSNKNFGECGYNPKNSAEKNSDSTAHETPASVTCSTATEK